MFVITSEAATVHLDPLNIIIEVFICNQIVYILHHVTDGDVSPFLQRCDRCYFVVFVAM